MAMKDYAIRTDLGPGLSPPAQPKSWAEVIAWMNWLSVNHDFVKAVEIYEVEMYGLDDDGKPQYRRMR